MLSTKASVTRIHRVAVPSTRALHDLVSLPNKKPIISYGPPGRSATTGHIATVFGCTGFLGRYLVSKLAKAGTQVIVPYRNEDEKRHLKVMGDLGQIVSLEWDLRSEDQIAECVRHSDIVYNLVGREYDTKNFTLHDVNATGAGRIAAVSAKAGVPRFVHVSHLNASKDSPSRFYQSKAAGENLVKEIYPDATILRPAVMYGYEDRLLTNMAVWPIWWKLNYGQTRIRPVHVFDVAQALTNLISMPSLPGTLSLPGPSTHTYSYLLDVISSITFVPSSRAPTVPKSVALFLAKLAQSVWWPAISPDEIVRRYIDDVGAGLEKVRQGEKEVLELGPDMRDWEKVGVVPDELENHAIAYLRRYRSALDYVRPVVIPPRPAIEAPEE